VKIKIEGISPYDGEYPLELDKFTNRDHKTIKDMSGLTATSWIEGFKNVDMTFFAALGVVAARRSGRFGPIINEDVFWDSEAGKISLIEEEADRAVNPTTPEAPTLSTRSGEHSSDDGDKAQVMSLPPTGTDSSATWG
jgi:hypothetical protein